MEVILLKNVEKLGYADDIVNVKPGYALNYLIPKGYAVIKNPANLAALAGRNRAREKREAKLLEQINEISNRLQAAQLKIGAKVGTSGKIFGSVTPYHLAEAIKNQASVEVDRRKITILEGDIKTPGTYSAEVGLGANHKVVVKFEVVAE
ncbi:MAG: 50S ribosomal protein L9 [Chitinophagales bacterium]|nr:50S ribosomal protein L9 [Chitinophagales bacterium]MDW8419701.1 50S ribosomal protein L9 [Chitinophagales bacterium]